MQEESIANQIRLQVYLSHAGVASRRASESLIQQGRVSVNGSIITELGQKVSLQDTVTLDGKPVHIEQNLQYIVLNKPPMFICSSFDTENRPLAKDLLPKEIQERLYSVGRLDYRSSGLIFFTNDGDFAANLSHPRNQIEKEYIVESTGIIDDKIIDSFSRGIEIDNIFYKSEKITRIGRKILDIVLIEGKNREIRRVFSYFHLHPKSLKRVRIGPVLLDRLPEGKTRELTNYEKETLCKKWSKNDNSN
ncbi:pseudouridine synthase [Spirochaetia bacterium]|nr:pseudouridine synthase [Spirochaetia bacterium]